jgi:uncharacterized membrane protein
MRNVSAAFLLSACVTLCAVACADAADFWPLPFPAPDYSSNFSYAYSISGDGQLVIGECNSPTVSVHGEGIRWQRAGSSWSVVELGLPTTPAGALNSPAQGVARDRSVIVGRASFGPPTGPAVDTYAWCWTNAAGFKMLPLPPSYPVAQANAATRDGAVIVGLGSPNTDYRSNSRPVVWGGPFTAGWTVALLDNAEGMANSVDRQGKQVVGWLRPKSASASIPAGKANNPITWSRRGGSWQEYWLQSLPADSGRGEAEGISSSGHMAVGYSGVHDVSYAPVCWHIGGSGHPLHVRALGMLPGYTSGIATAVSESGMRIVGFCNRLTAAGDFEYEAFVWDEHTGMKSLHKLLTAAGVHGADGWPFLAATSISDDGKTICGYGSDPQGVDHAWVASLP